MTAFLFPDPPIADGTEVVNTETGVTYRWDNANSRWIIVSSTTADGLVDTIGDLQSSINEITEDISDLVDKDQSQDDLIEEELDNRDAILSANQEKNNQQDAEIAELSQRLDAISENIGILEFKGDFTYVMEKSEDNCNAAFTACMLAANGDPSANSECIRLLDDCLLAVGQPLSTGTFTTVDTRGANGVEEIIISTTSMSGSTFDWLNLLTEGDYIEIYETVGLDTFLYEVVSDTSKVGPDEKLRVKFIRQTGEGDGLFNPQSVCEIRVFQKDLGLDLNEADERYVAKPYTVMFQDDPPTEGRHSDKVLRNGELWYDTSSLELFAWNNNAWTAAALPPSQDVVISSALDDISRISGDVYALNLEINSIEDNLELRKNIFYSDDVPTPTAPDGSSSVKNGDIWLDSNDLELKFYSQGAWINPDRTSGSVNLEAVLSNGNIADKDMFLTNGENDLIGISPTESRILVATTDEAIPALHLRHTDAEHASSTVQLKLDENGTRFDVECDSRVDNIHFRFDAEAKLDINKTGDAVFSGKVQVEPGTQGNEVATYQQLVDLEEEIEAISPSVERGEWTYIDDYHLDQLEEGQYFTAIVQTQVAHDQELEEITQRTNDCLAAAGDDPAAQAECTDAYLEEFHALVPIGDLKPIADFTQVTHLVFHKKDDRGVLHTFNDAVVGNHISILDEEDEDFLLGIITAIDRSEEDTISFEINLVQALGEADPSTKARVRIFSVAEGTDVTDFLRKTGDTMSGQLRIEADLQTREEPLLKLQPSAVVSNTQYLLQIGSSEGGKNNLVIYDNGEIWARDGWKPTASRHLATKEYVDDNSGGSPIGTIVFWGGLKSKIPSGWTECNGQTAPADVKAITGLSIIPDLRNWMPAGMGGIFGTQEGQRITSKIQKHKHSVTRLEPGSTQGNPDGAADASSSRYRYWRGNSTENGSSGSNTSKSTTEVGDDFTAPPVWIGVYIMRIA